MFFDTAIKYCVMGVFRAKVLLAKIEICSLYPRPVQVGIMHIQLLHTSASLTINENWDPDVRDDMEMMLNRHDFCNDMWSVCG